VTGGVVPATTFGVVTVAPGETERDEGDECRHLDARQQVLHHAARTQPAQVHEREGGDGGERDERLRRDDEWEIGDRDTKKGVASAAAGTNRPT